jgi:ApaG protein
MMAGAYRMVSDRGRQFDITIPTFSLDIPGERRVVN